MKSIDINDLINYYTCGYRFNSQKFTNDKHVSTLSDAELLSGYIGGLLEEKMLLILASKSKITLASLNKELNLIWSKLNSDQKLVFTLPRKIALKNYIKALKNRLDLLKNKEVLSYKLPYYVTVDDYQIDLYYTILNSSNGQYIYIHRSLDTDTYSDLSNYSMDIIYPMILTYAFSNFEGLYHKFYSELYSKVTISSKTNQMYNIETSKTFLSNLLKGIKQEVYIPQITHLNCRSCNRSDTCPYKYV